LCVSTERYEFLSHPNDEKKHSLVNHLIEVAQKTKEILSQTNFNLDTAGFYCGLLHDIGKLNPFYQKIFQFPKNKINEMTEIISLQYAHMHSPFSAWATSKLLDKQIVSEYKIQDMIICVIYGHHSKILSSLPEQRTSQQFRASQNDMLANLKKFHEIVNEYNEFSNLNWQKCLERFNEPIKFNIDLNDHTNTVKDFLGTTVLYSALLQADRGSFGNWVYPIFDIDINTSKLVNSDSNLGSFRDEFQKNAIQNHDFKAGISVLHAPTGIGKTKVFLDMISQYKEKGKMERVFYFSPLLALTEDFENKLLQTVKEEEDILIYNHLFAGSISEKKQHENGTYGEYPWLFDVESFNKKFIITTTQRFLITLYSNNQSDKLKLASFKNSLLIIDEVQTIPKFLLRNLIELLSELVKNMNTKVILVSATIPHELESLNKNRISDDLLNSYLNFTKKNISFIGKVDVPSYDEKRTLIMTNTRRKAATMFENVKQKYDQYNENLFYITSGIRKIDRIRLLEQLKNKEQNFIVVSTQVVEAGVDISFSKIFRECAPLDSIVQVMGRLNRENEYKDASLSIFQNDSDWKPYSELEYNESLKILKQIKNSIELYEKLKDYYLTISVKNQKNKELADKLSFRMAKMDFDGVWEFVYSNSLAEDEKDTVIIPDKNQWNQIKNDLTRSEKFNKNTFRKFVRYTASLPKSPQKLGILEYFDKDLLSRNILMPKLEYLDEVYDSKNNLGLDVWLTKK